MTKEEILAMKPGPELDTLVAEQVMGHPMPDFIPEDALDLYLVGTPIHCDNWTCVCRYDEGDTPKWVPDPYSTDISAAWSVVEKMKLKFYDFQGFCYNLITELFGTNISDCTFNTIEMVLRGLTPEAICKAALIATDVCKACE